MAIEIFKRTSNYFNTIDDVNSSSIDNQFNMIVDYINKKVKPLLDQLLNSTVPASNNISDSGKYYQNVGDSTTKWANITPNVFVNNSIDLQKIDKNKAGSILATNTSQELNTVTPTANDQILASRSNDTPIWKKLTGDNISDRGITGASIALNTITNQNLPAYLLQTQIADNSLVAAKFTQNVITTNKLGRAVDGDGLTIEKLTPALAVDFANYLWENIMPDNFLQTMNNNDWNRIMNTEAISWTDINRLAPWIATVNDVNIDPRWFLPIAKLNIPTLDNKREGFKSEHIAANSIDGKRLWYKTQYASTNNTISFVAEGTIAPEHLTPQLRTALGF